MMKVSLWKQCTVALICCFLVNAISAQTSLTTNLRQAANFSSDRSSDITWMDLHGGSLSDDLPIKTPAMAANQTTDWLILDQFEFNLPQNATVTGIEVQLERAALGKVKKEELRLTGLDGNGNSMKLNGTWTQQDEVYTFGGPGDLWGNPHIKPSTINDDAFGIALRITAQDNETIVMVDQASVRIYYQVPDMEVTYSVTEHSPNEKGSIRLKVQGGQPPYKVVKDGKTYFQLGQDPALFELLQSLEIKDELDLLIPNLTSNYYNITVSDAKQNVVSLQIPVPATAHFINLDGLVEQSGNLVAQPGNGKGKEKVTGRASLANEIDAEQGGGIQFTVGEMAQAYIAVGLRSSQKAQATQTSDLDLAFQIEQGQLAIYEKGNKLKDNIQVTAASVLSIQVNDLQVTFQVDQTTIQTTSLAASETLTPDILIKGGKGQVQAMKVVEAPFWPEFTAVVDHINCTDPASGNIDITISSTKKVTGLTYTWRKDGQVISNSQDLHNLEAGIYQLEITYSASPPIPAGTYTASYEVKTEISWRELINAATTPTDNSITKTTALYNWNSGAASSNRLKANEDGWAEFEVDDASSDFGVAFGFSQQSTDAEYYSIQYGVVVIFLNGLKFISPIESGTLIGPLSGFNQGDIVRVSRDGAQVRYIVNNTILGYATPVNPAQDLIVDASILSPGSAILNGFTSLSCPNFYVAQHNYVEMKRKLDGGYYLTVDGKLKFLYEEEYATEASSELTYRVYDPNNTQLYGDLPDGSGKIAGSPVLPLTYGDNRYEIDFSTLALSQDEFYTLEVINGKNEKRFLRFQYKQ